MMTVFTIERNHVSEFSRLLICEPCIGIAKVITLVNSLMNVKKAAAVKMPLHYYRRQYVLP